MYSIAVTARGRPLTTIVAIVATDSVRALRSWMMGPPLASAPCPNMYNILYSNKAVRVLFFCCNNIYVCMWIRVHTYEGDNRCASYVTGIKQTKSAAQ